MSKTLLQVNNVKKRYGQKEALKGVSFELFEGEIFGLLGVNGAGKTTLSSIIASLHPATEGDLIFQGKSIYTDIKNYRRYLGFCPQRPNLNPMLTLEQNLRLAGSYYNLPEDTLEQRMQQLIKQFELKPYLDQRALVLSGGYKQRFMIARSLLHNPKLLLLDEPTVGLDPHIRRQLWKKIKELKNNGVTVVLTTHYLDEAQQLSDRICVLDKGQVKLIDTPDKLMADFKLNNLEDVFIALTQEGTSEQE